MLDVRDLSVTLSTGRGVRPVLDGMTLQMAAGETLCLVGESGSGKSMTLLTLMGLLPPGAKVSSGSVRFQGEDVLMMPPERRRALRGAQMAMLFQDATSALNPTFRIDAQVAEAVALHSTCSRGEARARAHDLLSQVGIRRSVLRSYPHELSGGMRQRVMIAMGLAASPSLLLADEPVSALDVTVKAQILDLLDTLQRTYQPGLMLVTHDMGVVARMADRVAVVYGGRIVEEGPCADLLAKPRHPYTEALIRAIPRIDQEGIYSGGTLPNARGFSPRDIRPDACTFAPRCPHVSDHCRSHRPRLLPMEEGSSAVKVACHLLAGASCR